MEAHAATADLLSRWQLERVIEKIRSVLEPTQPYTWLLLREDGSYRDTCPEVYLPEREAWLATVETSTLLRAVDEALAS